jgi:uncharacterized membrane protein YqhA
VDFPSKGLRVLVKESDELEYTPYKTKLKMFRQIFSYRIIAILIALFLFINSLAFTIGGAWLSIKGISHIIKGEIGGEMRPGVMIMESVDIFLLALVFLIFAIGIIKLFIPDAHQSIQVKNLHWLKINDFTDLKMLLWEAVLTTLVVFFITGYVHKMEHGLDWEMLILPVSILLLAISYYVMRKSESHHNKHEDQPPTN